MLLRQIKFLNNFSASCALHFVVRVVRVDLERQRVKRWVLFRVQKRAGATGFDGDHVHVQMVTKYRCGTLLQMYMSPGLLR